eukprot:3676684-Prymnesium_polylepis.1
MRRWEQGWWREYNAARSGRSAFSAAWARGAHGARQARLDIGALIEPAAYDWAQHPVRKPGGERAGARRDGGGRRGDGRLGRSPASGTFKGSCCAQLKWLTWRWE